MRVDRSRLEAHAYCVRRLVAALLAGEQRQVARVLVVGLVIAAAVVALPVLLPVVSDRWAR